MHGNVSMLGKMQLGTKADVDPTSSATEAGKRTIGLDHDE